MRTRAQNEALLAEVRALLSEAAKHEQRGTCCYADAFGRAAAGALARYLSSEEKRERLARSPIISANRELGSMQ